MMVMVKFSANGSSTRDSFSTIMGAVFRCPMIGGKEPHQGCGSRLLELIWISR